MASRSLFIAVMVVFSSRVPTSGGCGLCWRFIALSYRWMSQSSSASGPSIHGGGGTGYDGQGSPAAYRVGALAYEPAVLCDCKLKACRWISWSNGQPGRRYYRCRRARTDMDCKFYRWVDEECSAWYKELFRDLRDAVWKLKKDVAKKEAEVEDKDMQLVAKQMEVEEKKKEIEDKQMVLQVKHQELNAKEEELIAKQQRLQAKDVVEQTLQAQLRMKNQCMDALVLSVLLVIILVVVMLNAK
ncbi:hypothetical protein BDA96_04G160100 [Sorghum bicolor]|uniref:GRF-type domain-containing protein n=1 Tax=Sorghum bicolor TaxID=4558 RepID=A0A921R5P6_SORBI|nr:hypothetical protein BDA96_04G160100 [Sorghum bicolor]